MPAYISTAFSFENSRIKKNFVRDFYEAIFDCGFAFKRGYYKDEGMPLEQIVEWNQNVLEQYFGREDDGSTKIYDKQILFQCDGYSELRGFWFDVQNSFEVAFIVPENNVTDSKDNFLADKVAPFRALSIKLWEKGLIDVVQTHSENGGAYSLRSLKLGPPIADLLLAIADKRLFESFPPEFFHSKKLTEIGNNGLLIDNLDPWGFFGYWRSLGEDFKCNK